MHSYVCVFVLLSSPLLWDVEVVVVNDVFLFPLRKCQVLFTTFLTFWLLIWSKRCKRCKCVIPLCWDLFRISQQFAIAAAAVARRISSFLICSTTMDMFRDIVFGCVLQFSLETHISRWWWWMDGWQPGNFATCFTLSHRRQFDDPPAQ